MQGATFEATHTGATTPSAPLPHHLVQHDACLPTCGDGVEARQAQLAAVLQRRPRLAIRPQAVTAAAARRVGVLVGAATSHTGGTRAGEGQGGWRRQARMPGAASAAASAGASCCWPGTHRTRCTQNTLVTVRATCTQVQASPELLAPEGHLLPHNAPVALCMDGGRAGGTRVRRFGHRAAGQSSTTRADPRHSLRNRHACPHRPEQAGVAVQALPPPALLPTFAQRQGRARCNKAPIRALNNCNSPCQVPFSQAPPAHLLRYEVAAYGAPRHKLLFEAGDV